MLKQLTLIAIIAGIFLGQPVQAQGKDNLFGVYEGMSLSGLEQDPEEMENRWKLKNVPEPHKLFSDYRAVGSESDGACGVDAVTSPTSDEQEFDRLFDAIVEELTSSYGGPTETIGDRYHTWQGAPAMLARNISVIEMFALDPDKEKKERAINVTFFFVNTQGCGDYVPYYDN